MTYTPADDNALSAALDLGYREGQASPVEELPADVVNEVVRVMAAHDETRPRHPRDEQIAAEDAAARQYLPGLPEDDVE